MNYSKDKSRRIKRLLTRLLLIFLLTMASLLYLPPEAKAKTEASNSSVLEIAGKRVENELNNKIWEARSQAQSEAEDYASKKLNVWVDDFQRKLETSGYLDWYFSYFVNKSIKDREILCHISHFVPFFPTAQPKCNIFIQEAQSKLIETVLKPLETDIDRINNQALGVFYNSLSHTLHNDFKTLAQDNYYQNMTEDNWATTEQKLDEIIPGFSGGALPAPSPVYLSMVTGRHEDERELSFMTELGEVVFKVPSLFARETEEVAEVASRKNSIEQAIKGGQVTLQETSMKVYSVDSLESVYSEMSAVESGGSIVQLRMPDRLLIQETTIENL